MRFLVRPVPDDAADDQLADSNGLVVGAAEPSRVDLWLGGWSTIDWMNLGCLDLDHRGQP